MRIPAHGSGARLLPLRDALLDLRVALAADTGLPRAVQADAAGIRRVLGLATLTEAMAVARDADDAAHRITRQLAVRRGRAAASWLARSAPPPGGEGALDDALVARDVVLAAPLHARVVAMIGRRVLQGAGPLAVQRTRLSAPFLDAAFTDAGAGAAFTDDRAMLARARQPARGTGTLWITFPDHAAAAEGGRLTARLRARSQGFTYLELLLASRLGAAAWTLDAGPDGTPHLREARWTPGARAQVSTAEVQALYDDIGASLGRVLAASPAGILSWAGIPRNDSDTLRQRDLRVTSTLRGVIAAWAEAVPGGSAPVQLLDALARADA